jgi:hypothetical protein
MQLIGVPIGVIGIAAALDPFGGEVNKALLV